MEFSKKILPLILLFAIGLLSLPQSAEAQKKGRKKKKGALTSDQILHNRLVQHVTILAHDSLEGRRTGTLGEEKAFNYIIAQYKDLGITGGVSSGYLQSFEINEGNDYKKTSNLKIDGVSLQPGRDFFPFPWSADGDINSDAAVALHESGEAWWIDIDGILEKNKDNPHVNLGAHLYEVAGNAAKKGATAVFFFNGGLTNDNMKYLPTDRTDAASIPVVYFTKQAVEAFKINATASPLVNGVIKLEAVKRTGNNVIAAINNNAPNTIVLGAHYDHLGYGEDENSRHTGDPEIHNGADDNASGTAAILELARLLKQKADTRFNYIFIHFSGEELGLYGSKYFTENPVVDLGRITYMINLDMVGRLSDSSNALTVGGIGTSPAWGQLVTTTSDFTFKIDSSGTGPSDHTSFYRKDIPVLFFFTGLHTDYHKPSDDADKINYAGMVKIVKYIDGIITRSPAAEKLAFAKTREQSMGTGRFKVSIGIMPDYTFSGTGVKADGVIEGRPAQKAGMQANDVILQLGEVLVTSVETYMQALNMFEKGQSTTLVVKRGNEIIELPITF